MSGDKLFLPCYAESWAHERFPFITPPAQEMAVVWGSQILQTEAACLQGGFCLCLHSHSLHLLGASQVLSGTAVYSSFESAALAILLTDLLACPAKPATFASFPKLDRPSLRELLRPKFPDNLPAYLVNVRSLKV